jgi:hypothetical protein
MPPESERMFNARLRVPEQMKCHGYQKKTCETAVAQKIA